jgi:hypothetical protein
MRVTVTRTWSLVLAGVALLMAGPALPVQAQSALSPAFTYQGRLTDGGSPAQGSYDLRFFLYDAANDGGQVGATLDLPAVPVANGLFTVVLDFGSSPFAGSRRWLEVHVSPAGAGTYEPLLPRQEVTASPQALYSLQSAFSQTAASVPVGGVPAGSDNYVQNTITPQAGASFNVAGSGTVGGALSAGSVTSSTQYNIGGNRVLAAGGQNVFVGIGTGAVNGGFGNVFVGNLAGTVNTTGVNNTFLGTDTGRTNSTGQGNTFVGRSSGFDNTTGNNNTALGVDSSRFNTTGSNNTYIGNRSGYTSSLASNNTFLGYRTGEVNLAVDNVFVGVLAGFSNTTGPDNVFVGRSAGQLNTTGASNTFVGAQAGRDNTTAEGGTFLGHFAGVNNTTGLQNSFVGDRAGQSNTVGANNTFVGGLAGAGSNGTGNTFVGAEAGQATTNGGNNTFLGVFAGEVNTTGGNNTFLGVNAGLGNTTGSNNTTLGTSANVGIGTLTFATALGAGATVSNSNSVVLGRSTDTVRIPGNLVVTGSVAKGSGTFRIDHPLDPQNKYLSHSFVESPDMMNVYNGNVTLDRDGGATVELPAWFEALNRDCRYQLTALGRPGPGLHVAQEVQGNRFRIAGGRPGLKVSWQVTGIRRDPFSEAHRTPVEEDKPQQERGTYLHPEAWGPRNVSGR